MSRRQPTRAEWEAHLRGLPQINLEEYVMPLPAAAVEALKRLPDWYPPDDFNLHDTDAWKKRLSPGAVSAVENLIERTHQK
jgi:hypothetical protein